jgi:hypothetical protein
MVRGTGPRAARTNHRLGQCGIGGHSQRSEPTASLNCHAADIHSRFEQLSFHAAKSTSWLGWELFGTCRNGCWI